MTNIAEILKYCPKGMKLYSPILGECTLCEIDNNHNCWEPDIFALYKKDDTYEYICLRDRWKQCIPYDETRVGTKE